MSHSPDSSIPPEVQEALEAKSPEARARILRVWDLLGTIDDATSISGAEIPDTESALAALEQTLDHPAPQRKAFAIDRRAHAPSRTRLGKWITTGTIAGLLLIATFIGLWRQPVVVTAGPGELVTAQLPDGSTVELNSGSSLEYRRGFASFPGIDASERQVRLDGEAYFDITKMSRPFIVSSFNAEVRVLGTTFNVRARHNDPLQETFVTLSSGRVEVVSTAYPDQPALLTEAGQATRVRQQSSQSIPALLDSRLDRTLAWRSKGFSAVDMPLAAVFAEIERRYAITVQAEPGVDQSRAINVFIADNPLPEDILLDICISQQCQYRQDNGGFVIFPSPETP